MSRAPRLNPSEASVIYVALAVSLVLLIGSSQIIVDNVSTRPIIRSPMADICVWFSRDRLTLLVPEPEQQWHVLKWDESKCSWLGRQNPFRSLDIGASRPAAMRRDGLGIDDAAIDRFYDDLRTGLGPGRASKLGDVGDEGEIIVRNEGDLTVIGFVIRDGGLVVSAEYKALGMPVDEGKIKMNDLATTLMLFLPPKGN